MILLSPEANQVSKRDEEEEKINLAKSIAAESTPMPSGQFTINVIPVPKLTSDSEKDKRSGDDIRSSLFSHSSRSRKSIEVESARLDHSQHAKSDANGSSINYESSESSRNSSLSDLEETGVDLVPKKHETSS